MEAIAFAAVPDVPDERAVMKQLAMFLEELIAQPIIEIRTARIGQQLRKYSVIPVIAPDGPQQLQQPLVRRTLAADGRNADYAVVIRQLFQTVRGECRTIGETGTGLARPPVAEQPRHGHLQRLV